MSAPAEPILAVNRLISASGQPITLNSTLVFTTPDLLAAFIEYLDIPGVAAATGIEKAAYNEVATHTRTKPITILDILLGEHAGSPTPLEVEVTAPVDGDVLIVNISMSESAVDPIELWLHTGGTAFTFFVGSLEPGETAQATFYGKNSLWYQSAFASRGTPVAALTLSGGVGSDPMLEPFGASLIFDTFTTATFNGSTALAMKTGLVLENVDNTSDSAKEAAAVTLFNKTLGAGTVYITTGLPVVLQIAASDTTTDITSGAGKVTFRMPFGMTVTAVRASVSTAPTGSTIIVDINEAGSTILSTKLSIDASEKTSITAASAAVISDAALASDAEMTIDFDQVGSSTPGKGVVVTLIGLRT